MRVATISEGATRYAPERVVHIECPVGPDSVHSPRIRITAGMRTRTPEKIPGSSALITTDRAMESGRFRQCVFEFKCIAPSFDLVRGWRMQPFRIRTTRYGDLPSESISSEPDGTGDVGAKYEDLIFAWDTVAKKDLSLSDPIDLRRQGKKVFPNWQRRPVSGRGVAGDSRCLHQVIDEVIGFLVTGRGVGSK